VVDPEAAYTKIAFLQAEGAEWLWDRWPAYRWGIYEKTFGALEVNLEAYPTFVGNPRILVVSRSRLGELPLTANDLAIPRVAVSKTDLVAGKDSYVLKVRDMPNAMAVFLYSLNGAAPAEFREGLNSAGEKRIRVGPDTPKGEYRILGLRKDTEPDWHNIDLTLFVR
jgi:hypothetical protein